MTAVTRTAQYIKPRFVHRSIQQAYPLRSKFPNHAGPTDGTSGSCPIQIIPFIIADTGSSHLGKPVNMVSTGGEDPSLPFWHQPHDQRGPDRRERLLRFLTRGGDTWTRYMPSITTQRITRSMLIFISSCFECGPLYSVLLDMPGDEESAHRKILLDELESYSEWC